MHIRFLRFKFQEAIAKLQGPLLSKARSPSPLPSPSGRGRAKDRVATTPGFSGSRLCCRRCSLSLRERAGVRGNRSCEHQRRATSAIASQFSSCASLAVLAAILMLPGCSKKADVNDQVSQLEKAFPAAAPAAAAPVETPAATAQAPASEANAYVKAALSAVQANDYAGGVIALQKVQRMPGVTYQQLVAVERTKQAMTTDLVNRADRGDAKAKADLAAIEKSLSQ